MVAHADRALPVAYAAGFLAADLLAESMLAMPMISNDRFVTLALQKSEVSGINFGFVSVVMVAAWPLIAVASVWKITAVAACFVYCMALRSRCLGAYVLALYQNKPTTMLYAALYTAGYATFFYSLILPNDLLLL